MGERIERRKDPTSTSGTLLGRVRRDDDEAWDRLVALYAPTVSLWCRGTDLDDADRADIVQEVFQAVALKIGAFRKSRAGDSFRGWLRTITRNKIHDHYRRRAKQPRAAGGSSFQQRLSAVPVSPQERSAENRSESNRSSLNDEDETKALCRRALELIRDRFHERTWMAFWRTVIDGQTPKEVGDELGMTPGAVRVAKSRVLQKLRGEFGDVLD